jgi:mediator of RNA polymerase II transcription subunit 14
VNGIGGLQNRHVEDTEWSKQKKSLLFNFGHNNHARFVKLLVLTGWAADYANDIKKVINMNALMSETTASQDFAADELQWVKELATTLQEKNPDMRTALEILSKGKAEWIPDVSCACSYL